METKETSNVGDRIKAVRLRLGLNQSDFGEKLGGLAISTISGYESGDRPPRADTLSHIAILAGVSLDWLITGKEASAVRAQNDHVTKKAEIAATIEPGRKSSSSSQMFSRRPVHPAHGQESRSHIASPLGQSSDHSKTEDDQDHDEIINEDEAVDQTRYVLRSKTVYRSALLSNIRAFYQGVKREEEMQGIRDEVVAMRSENREMRDENRKMAERMEELLLSLGATATKKRDPAANA